MYNMRCHSEKCPNSKRLYLYKVYVLNSMTGSNRLGLDLKIDKSTNPPSFEFASVEVDVTNYQSCLEEVNFRVQWIFPDDQPEVSILFCQIV